VEADNQEEAGREGLMEELKHPILVVGEGVKRPWWYLSIRSLPQLGRCQILLCPRFACLLRIDGKNESQ
jgi:hypothetical protein